MRELVVMFGDTPHMHALVSATFNHGYAVRNPQCVSIEHRSNVYRMQRMHIMLHVAYVCEGLNNRERVAVYDHCRVFNEIYSACDFSRRATCLTHSILMLHVYIKQCLNTRQILACS